MKILLTGLTSFTGKHFLPMIQKIGWEIIPLVRKPIGFKNEIVWDFVSSLPDVPICDAVVHLAADINFNNELDINLYRVNTIATAKLVSYAKKYNSYFIFASSIAVNGFAQKIGQGSPISIVNQYGASKYLAEEIIKDFLNNYAILRISGIYGLDGPTHLGLNKSIREAFYDGVIPTLRGSGSSKRNYICVVDVARWIVSLLQNCENKCGDSQHIYYLADSEIKSIRQYLDAIIDKFIPGENIKSVEGLDGTDCIVECSTPNFSLIKFEDYLTSLKKTDKDYDRI